MNRISFFSATAAAALGFLLAALGSGWYAILVWTAIALTTQSQRVVDFVEDFLERRARRSRMSSPHHDLSRMSESEVRE
jgi:hypothetical protein